MRLLASTIALTLASVGPALAQGISLYGETRLGLGYNIDNDGGAVREPTRSVVVDAGTPDERVVDTRLGATDDLRAVSRVRWGAVMTGESDSGIAFGAEIRADNAEGGGTGETSDSGQIEGSVFVSGAWGTLTFGDTNGADEQHVGDATGNLSLTGLGDFNETPFISNGGGFGDDTVQFANDPDARPTVRYDYDFAGFGFSLSTNRELSDVGVGASYTLELANGSVTAGAGYYDFVAFRTEATETEPDGLPIDGGEQWSVGLTGNYGDFGGGIVYIDASAGDTGDLAFLLLGGTATFGAWGVGAYYATVVDAGGGEIEAYDGSDSYGASIAYDLGGGATVNAGVAYTYGRGAIGAPGDVSFAPALGAATVADFGISMVF